MPNNLPRQVSRFVGREDDERLVACLLSETRLLTLTGPGGVGKTRLALEVAEGATDLFSDGVWLVDLSRVNDPSDLLNAVRSALEIQPVAGQSLSESIIASLRRKSLLLLLDNCEHVLDAAAEFVHELLAACGDVAVLTTSREPLGLRGETSWVVPPLSVPPPGETPGPHEMHRWGAVALFIDRARKARPGFQLTTGNVGVVVEVCRRLDGMPLGIELAAARCRVLTVDQILSGMEDRFRLFAGRTRAVAPRHQGLEASIDWSYNLLEEDEKRLLARLSVFAASFNAEEAESVCSSEPLGRSRVRDLLYSLADKSLVQVSADPSQARLRLLETIKAYAATKLGDEADDVRLSMLNTYTELSHQAATAWYVDQTPWFAWIREELPNIAECVRYAGELKHDSAAAIPVNLSWYLWALAERPVLEPWLKWILEHGPSPKWLYGAFLGLGILDIGEKGGAFFSYPYLEKAVNAAESMGDPFRLAEALRFFALARWDLAEVDQALADLRRGLQTIAALDDPRAPYVLSATENILGECLFSIGGLDEAERLWGSALARAGKSRMAAIGVMNRGRHMLAQGRIDEARALFGEALESAREVGNRLYQWVISEYGACALAARGDMDAVEASLETSSVIARQMDHRSHLADKQQQYLERGVAVTPTSALILRFPILSRIGYAVVEPGGTIKNDREEFDSGAFAFSMGDIRAAGNHFEEYLAKGMFAWPDTAAEARVALGLCKLADGEIDEAVALMTGSLKSIAEFPDPTRLAYPIEALAMAACTLGNYERAARLHGAARGIRSWNRTLPELFMREAYQETIAKAGASLGEKAFANAVDDGERLSREEAFTFAAKGRGPRKRPPFGWEGLSPVELQVVRLIREGLSNPQIATRMFISRRTVESHVSSALQKLGLSSRVDLALEAERREPA